MEEHSKTPWRIEPATKKDNWRIIAANNQVVSTFSGNMDMDNARRIVACVNACAGMPQDDVEELAKFGVMELTVYADDMRQQRDKLQQQLATERASLFAESQRKQQLEQQVAELVGVLVGMVNMWKTTCDAMGWEPDHLAEYDAARAVIQKVRGGEC